MQGISGSDRVRLDKLAPIGDRLAPTSANFSNISWTRPRQRFFDARRIAMRRTLTWVAAAWMFAATPIFAQIPSPPVLPESSGLRDAKVPPPLPEPGFPPNPGLDRTTT